MTNLCSFAAAVAAKAVPSCCDWNLFERRSEETKSKLMVINQRQLN